jgi:acyl carrier protein
MTREETLAEILKIFRDEFEIEDPGLDDDLRKIHDFDSIDAIELLVEIERLMETHLTQEEKKQAMNIRTINDILDYIERMAKNR